MTTPIALTEYKASAITGKQRVCGGKFGNPFEGTPWLSIEEEVITYDAQSNVVYRNSCGGATATLDAPETVIEKRNPLDDTVIGTLTHGEVMVAIYSLCRSMQTARDTALQG